MNTLKTVWILVLATVLVGTICWSILVLTGVMEKTFTATEKTITQVGESFESGSKTYYLVSEWLDAIFPREAASDVKKMTIEYWNEYGKQDLKDIFTILKSEAAQRRLGITPVSQPGY